MNLFYINRILPTLFLLLSTYCQAQKYDPILTIDHCSIVCLADDESFLFVIDSVNNKPRLSKWSLELTGKPEVYRSKLPDNPVSSMVYNPSSDLIYLITTKVQEGKKEKQLDAIYSFSPIRDKLKCLYKEKEIIDAPGSVDLVGSLLVMPQRMFGNQPLLFNLEDRSYEVFSIDDKLRMLCSAPQKKSFVVIRIDEIKDDDTVPVYLMGLDRKLTSSVGIYSSSMIISTERESQLPGFTSLDKDYLWIDQVYNTSGFPLSGFAIATRQGLAERYNQTSNLFDIVALLDANCTYLVARGRNQVYVYNTKQ